MNVWQSCHKKPGDLAYDIIQKQSNYKTMVRHLTQILFILLTIFLTSSELAAVNRTMLNQNLDQRSVFELSTESLMKKNKVGLETELGRKLTFQEKISLTVVKKKMRKNKNFSGTQVYGEVKTDPFAIGGFVTGVVGLLLIIPSIFFAWFAVPAIICSILGIVLSSVGLHRLKGVSLNQKGKGLAIVGLITGIMGFLFWSYIAIFIAG